MKHRLIGTILILGFCHFSFSQEIPYITGNYFSLGLAIPIVKYLDKGHTPNIYKSSSGLAVNLSLNKVTTNHFSKFSFNFTFSTLSNRDKRLIYSSLSDFINFHLSYQFATSVYRDFSTILYLGPKINLDFFGNNYQNLKSNNSFSFNNRIYLDANLVGQYRFSSVNYYANSDHSISLINYDIRSKWNTLLPFDGITPITSPIKLMKYGKIITFNKFLAIHHHIDLAYRDLKTKNFFDIAHNYQYSYNFNSPHPLYIGINNFELEAHLIYR